MNYLTKKYISLVSLFLIILITTSCSRLYFGPNNLAKFSTSQPNELGPVVSAWEDGMRTTGQRNEFEWWYFDGKLEDGSILVAYFWKVHFIADQYFIGFNYRDPQGNDFFKMKYFKKKNVSFSSDSCDVEFGNNHFKGNLESYSIKINPDDFDGIGFDLKLSSKLKPYRPQDGIIKAGDDYFAWLAAVPNGSIDGDLVVNGQKTPITGSGYHDHNWGNTPLQHLFDNWVWFRGEIEDKTVVAAVLYMTDKRGGYDVPILYVADSDSVLINRFGESGLYSKKSARIEGLYNKKNEPLFNALDMITENGYKVNIKGKSVLDNSALFKRMGMPLPLRLAMNAAKIDPFYTRFDSDMTLKIKDEEPLKGFGVFEIMDLK
ncbi:MAG: lipocalin-like domain-containing protein [Candidatus Marinimicrobia bacterium]|nr:lipocalin-like domain-containing protein [Candidatus Neomarinimicrobiota bacterium]